MYGSKELAATGVGGLAIGGWTLGYGGLVVVALVVIVAGGLALRLNGRVSSR